MTAVKTSSFNRVATSEGSYWRSDLPASQLVKLATLGGDQEQGFEQAFSSLAYSFIKDRSPRLLDYIVGFQLIDRNDDNTKAVGIFGFKVGKQWLYAPVFFLNGDFKGHELLFIKNQDIFVPMKENWVNYVLARKPHILGESSQKDVYQLGGLAPNIERLSWPPSSGGKYGSDQSTDKLAALADAASAALQQMQSGGLPGRMAEPSFQSPAPTAGPDAMTSQLQTPPTTGSAPTMSLDAAGDGGGGAPSGSAGMSVGSGVGGAGKSAAMVDAWARPVLPMIAAAATKMARFLYRGIDCQNTHLDMQKVASAPFKASLALHSPDLREVCASDLQMAAMAWNAARQYPLIKLAFDDFYGKDFFASLAPRLKAAADAAGSLLATPAKQAAVWPKLGSILPRKQASAPPAVKILTDADVSVTKNVPASDIETKKKILHHGYLVKDERKGDEISKAYNTQVKQTLLNPSETGLYDVLERPGSFSRMLIISHPIDNAGGNDFCTVVRLDGDSKAWLNSYRNSVFARDLEQDASYRDWWKSLPEKRSLTKGALYVAVSETGEGTVPFEVRETYPDAEYELYKVDFKDFAAASRPGYLPKQSLSDPYDGNVSTWDARLVINAKDGSKLRAVGGELHVPSTFRFLKLKDPPKPKKDSDGILSPVGYSSTGSEDQPIVPGDIKDVQLLLTEKTSALKLHADQHEIITTSVLGTKTAVARQAMFDLILEHGLTEKAAQELVKVAQAKGHVAIRIDYGPAYPLTKHADYPSPGAGPTSPAIPPPTYGTEPIGYNNVNAIYPQEENIKVPGLDSAQTDPRIYDPFLMPDQRAIQTAQTARQQGQKEIFDVSMLQGMLKNVRQDNLVEKYLPVMMKCLDALGRQLFIFYYHQDDFADRYGTSELADMEDAIRNTFESLGDLVLTLREKSTDLGEDSDTDPSIKELASN